MAIEPLEPDRLRPRCDPESLDFETTAELEEPVEALGQERALAALRFGVDIRAEGYNLFVLGPTGSGRHTTVRRLLDARARTEQRSLDRCYLANFDDPQQPHAVELAAGRGRELKAEMEKIVEDLAVAIPAAFETDEYQSRVQEIQQRHQEEHEKAFEALRKRAEEKDIAFLPTPGGFAFAPKRDGEVLAPDAFQKLPEDERDAIEASIRELQRELQAVVQEVPKVHKRMHEEIRAIDQETARFAVRQALDGARERWKDLPRILAYLDSVEESIISDAKAFRNAHGDGDGDESSIEPASMHRYQVNLLVDHADTEGAPVLYETHPSYPNLIGRVEYLSQLGNLVTDFMLVRPGALHRANGGYLILDARDVLTEPYAWDGLKKALFSRCIRIESLGQVYGLVSTLSLEPEPMPLDLKVVLVGERWLYYLLRSADPDFGKLFKVAVDFEDRIERDGGGDRDYARMIATLAREHDARPLHRDAVAAVIEQGARLVDDAERLSTHMGDLRELLCEADYWARDEGAEVIGVEHVRRAIDARMGRSGRLRDRIQEEIERGTIDIATDGARTAQVNGLSVLDLGDVRFGRPTRITATVRLGAGKVVDVEREVDLGGSLHSKGVLILSHLLASRYVRDRPFSLSASLAFEQSYGPVDGDSASAAELCTILSALAEVPLKQSIAITGSVNQLGQVQAIGGVNEKIEGFHDLCAARGLTGEQGVVIPKTNALHLVLRPDVVEAVRNGRFRVWTVETVDDAIEVLTGLPAGARGDDGHFPPDSVNGRVEARLVELADLRRAEGRPEGDGEAAGASAPGVEVGGGRAGGDDPGKDDPGGGSGGGDR